MMGLLLNWIIILYSITCLPTTFTVLNFSFFLNQEMLFDFNFKA